MAGDFDLEAALRYVHSGRRPEPVERVAVFLPESMRAERPAPPARPIPKIQPKTPDWSTIPKREPVTTGAIRKLDRAHPRWSFTKLAQTLGVHIEAVRAALRNAEQTLALVPPSERRQFGCSICGSRSVMCRDDGTPYAHKCSHRRWCKTERGHPRCPECEATLIDRMDAQQQNFAARRELAENIRVAEAALPQVAWEIVCVIRAAKCVLCQEFLQGQRAVRFYTWNPDVRSWQLGGGLQCLSHPRPGVPMAEMSAQYFEETS